MDLSCLLLETTDEVVRKSGGGEGRERDGGNADSSGSGGENPGECEKRGVGDWKECSPYLREEGLVIL